MCLAPRCPNYTTGSTVMAGFRAAAGARAGGGVQDNILATRDLLSEAVRSLDRVPHSNSANPPPSSTGQRTAPNRRPAVTSRDEGNRNVELHRPAPSFSGHSIRQSELNWPLSGRSSSGFLDRRQPASVRFQPFNPMSVGVKRSKVQRTKKKKIAMWEKEFICLAKVGQTHVPTPLEKAELYRGGLGMKSLLLLEYGDPWEFHNEIMKMYPKLHDGGGYELLRTCGSSRELNVIPPPSGGYVREEHRQPSKGIHTTPSKGSLLGGRDHAS